MGLIKRTDAQGGTTYSIRYWVSGREHQEVVGPSKRQAELALAKRRTQIREGKFFEEPPGWKMPYTTLLDRYLAYSRVAKKPLTADLDRRVVEGHIRPLLGSLPLRDLTPAKVLSYVQHKLEVGLAPATVYTHFAVIKHSCTMAVTWELLREHPLRTVHFPVPIDNARSRYLAPGEFDRLLAGARPLWRRLILLAVHTGMRKAEMLTLRWEQIDEANAFLVLETGMTKNRRQHVVALNAVALEVLREQRAEQERLGYVTPWVFYNPRTGTHYRRDSDTAWYRLLRTVGIENFHFHDLRHTHASHLRMQGADLLTIKEALGHQDLKSTARYAHISPLHRLEMVKRLEAVLPANRDKTVK